MTDSKYSDLLTNLVFKKTNGKDGGKNSREVFVQGKTIQGFDLNFIIGVFESPGDWAPEWGAHTHPFDELLVFFGFSNDLNYLGADMELSMGKEREKRKFSDPMVIVAPSNLPHCPLITEKVYQPFGHFHIALGERYLKNQKTVEQDGETDGNKYTHLYNQMVVKDGPGGADARQIVTMAGSELENMDVNIMMGLYDKPGPWETQTHVHPYDEVMVFFSLDQTDINNLGAEMTVEIGAEHECHTFDKPTAIAFPKGTPHFPITCNKVDRPYAVMRIGLSSEYRSE